MSKRRKLNKVDLVVSAMAITMTLLILRFFFLVLKWQ